MPNVNLTAVADQMQTKWAPRFQPELAAKTLLPGLVNREYEGEIRNQGVSKVRVSQVSVPQAQRIPAGQSQFQSAPLTFSKVDVDADQRCVAAIEVLDIAELQSQIGSPDGKSEIRNALMKAVELKLNEHLYSLVSPSTASPDHLLTSEAVFTAEKLRAIRTLAAKAKWDKLKGWFGLLSPDYYEDALGQTVFASKDYVEGSAVTIGGQVANNRYGFNLLEDDSRSLVNGLFFHPDFLYLVTQTEPVFKLSDLHPQNKFGYLLSIDFVYGAKLGLQGDKKHIFMTNASTNDVALG